MTDSTDMTDSIGMNRDYVIEDDFAFTVADEEEETREERKVRERVERREFFRFMFEEHREVLNLQVVALIAAVVTLSITLAFHPPSDSAFDEARSHFDTSFPQPSPAFYLLAGAGCAVFAFIWPILAGAFSDRRRRLVLTGMILLGALSPLFMSVISYIRHGEIGIFSLALIFYGELIVYSAPLPLAVVGISRHRQEYAVAGVMLMICSVFAGLHDPELDFNLMDPSGTEMLLIYLFGLSLLVFIEGAYLSIRLTTYLRTIYSGGTGVPTELNIGRIIRTFLYHGVMAAGAALFASFFALNYEEILLSRLPGAMGSSRELVGVYGKVIFSTLFLLLLLVMRLIMPDLSKYVSQRTASRDEEEDDEGDMEDRADLSVYTKKPDAAERE